MNEKKIKILILEDMEERINLLKEKINHWHLTDNVDIIWKTNVGSFEAWVNGNKNSPPDLIIFDHDLDISHYESWQDDWGIGKEPKVSHDCAKVPNGADAAKLIEWTDVPVVIWSVNRYGAMNIRDILNDKGINSVRLPFSYIICNVVCKMIKAMIDE